MHFKQKNISLLFELKLKKNHTNKIIYQPTLSKRLTHILIIFVEDLFLEGPSELLCTIRKTFSFN